MVRWKTVFIDLLRLIDRRFNNCKITNLCHLYLKKIFICLPEEDVDVDDVLAEDTEVMFHCLSFPSIILFFFF